MTKEVIVKATGEKKIAVYAANSSGNMRYNVDGKFYTDKQFDKLFKAQDEVLSWKADCPALFKEILSANDSMWIMKQPLIIVDSIMREAAQRAIELQDEKMIAIMARLGMYEACHPSHPEHQEITDLIKRHF